MKVSKLIINGLEFDANPDCEINQDIDDKPDVLYKYRIGFESMFESLRRLHKDGGIIHLDLFAHSLRLDGREDVIKFIEAGPEGGACTKCGNANFGCCMTDKKKFCFFCVDCSSSGVSDEWKAQDILFQAVKLIDKLLQIKNLGALDLA